MIAIGLLAGLLGAILGLGGGIIMLPALQLLLEYEPALMVGTTMLAVVFTSASGAWGHFRNGNVFWREGALIGAGGLVGMVLGSWVFKRYLSLNSDILLLLLGILFLFMTVKMSREAWREFRAAATGAAVITEPAPLGGGRVAALLLLGALTGVFSGMLGVGGGWIMVPGLLMISRVSPHQAVGTTLLAMLPIALLGAGIKLYQGFVNVPEGLLLGLGAALGALLGAYVSRYIPSRIMKVMFALIFLLLAAQYLL